MDVLFLSPGFPAEMPLFVRGLAEVGARVLGVGDQPAAALPEEARRALSEYLQVGSLLDGEALAREVRAFARGREIDRVECLWEPAMLAAARLRELLGVPGQTVAETLPFRDKETMKQVLDAAGLRTPRHARARTAAECRAAAARNTYPLREPAELERALELLRHVDEVSVEEYVEGEELTFDTISAGGEVLFENVAWYRPKPLVARLNAWIHPQAVCLRDLEAPALQGGRRLGREVLRALSYSTGFAHMEWFLTPSGEAVFGEIGARPPGARLVHVMNYTADVDLFRGWAEAVCHGRFSQASEKRYNAAIVFQRAEGAGVVRRIEGLEALMARYGEHVAGIDLVRVGEPSRDWRQVLVGDGWIVVRHPSLEACCEIADRFGSELRIHAS